MQKNLVYIALSIVFLGCQSTVSDDYASEIEDFRKARVAYLKSEEGYLNLAGLYWLEDGEYSFGAHPDNLVRFPPKAPNFIGTFRRHGDSLFMTVDPGIEVLVNKQPVNSEILLFDGDSLSLEAALDSFRWFAIDRDKDLGIRLRDFSHPSLEKLEHIESFPVNPDYRVEATWIPYDSPKVLKMPNQTGQIIDMECVGAFRFSLFGEEYTLEPVGELYNNEYFLMIYDKTSGEETYGSGRYMYIPKPDAAGKTVIDFNKAFNPPCVFTEYATCLFPHEENRLPIRIEAGEKYPKSWSFE